MPSSLDIRVPARAVWILAGISFLSVGCYLAFSGFYYHTGFPLDDAWIHQTYARNLALRGEWSFLAGHPSGGSTAPLWSAVLAIGFWLGLAPYIWAVLLGALVLWGLSVLGESGLRQMVSSYHPRFPWVGVALALEWHMVWSAASGMETLLFAFLATVVLLRIITGSQKYFSLGLLIGFSIWVRPDGVTLLFPAAFVILLMQSTWSKRLYGLVNLGIGFGSLAVLYLLFNLMISGSPLPNTFYAKQAEYAQYLELPFLIRFGSEALPVLKGVGIILLPGLLFKLVIEIRHRDWSLLVAAIWFVGFLALYAWRLPVTYQYGRYVMPAMPVFFLLGLAGMLEFIQTNGRRWRWIISVSWRLAAGFVLLAFWVLGGIHYAQDVAVIESEMVATAKWVSANIPPDALVAAHDIGALGYFGGHSLVDLAGLVSPEVIPFLRSEDRIAAYLDERGVAYLVTFPDWYPNLISGLRPVFTSGAPFSPAQGGSNMSVYRWPAP
jgi:hypothetical protein